MNDLNMNRLPVPTWNQCGVNSAPKAAALPEIPGDDWGEANIAFTLPAGVGEAENDFTAFSESGMGEAVDTYLLENATVRHALTVAEDTKVEKGGTIEWVSGSFGSHTSCLYPMSILAGEGARMEFTGITFAGAGQDLDTGAKVVHAAPNTSSHITTKSIARDGGISNFRSSVTVLPGAKNSRSAVSCESLMLDDRSRSDTIPEMDIRCDAVDVGHEAKIGRISEEAVFYLMSRGLSEEDARALIVGGFAEPIAKELPVEYAVEMNNLIHLEMKGSIG